MVFGAVRGVAEKNEVMDCCLALALRADEALPPGVRALRGVAPCDGPFR